MATKSKKTQGAKKTTTKKKPQASKPKKTMAQPKHSTAVMDAIKKDGVKMRPSWHFGLFGLVLGLSVILVGFFTSLLMSAIVDEVRDASDSELFALRGNGAFADFPWVLLILTVLLLFVSYHLIKKLDFSYRHRSFIVFGSIALTLIIGASFFSSIDASRSFRDNGPLERFSTLSRSIQDRVIRGTVTEISDDSIKVDVRGSSFDVRASRDSIEGQDFEVGDEITVLGEHKDDGVFEAERLRRSSRRGVRGATDFRR